MNKQWRVYFVPGLTSLLISNPNVSSSTDQCIPRACSISSSSRHHMVQSCVCNTGGGSRSKNMHLHDVCIRGIIISICPPQEPQGILVFLTHMYLMKHLFDVSSEHYFAWQKRRRTPTKLLATSGPVSKFLLSEVPSHSAAAWNTMCTLPGLVGLVTRRCGRYQCVLDSLTLLTTCGQTHC